MRGDQGDLLRGASSEKLAELREQLGIEDGLLNDEPDEDDGNTRADAGDGAPHAIMDGRGRQCDALSALCDHASASGEDQPRTHKSEQCE